MNTNIETIINGQRLRWIPLENGNFVEYQFDNHTNHFKKFGEVHLVRVVERLCKAVQESK
jgi:hypothetical protein